MGEVSLARSRALTGQRKENEKKTNQEMESRTKTLQLFRLYRNWTLGTFFFLSSFHHRA